MAAVNEALRYVIYLYVKHSVASVKNYALYTKPTNSEKSVIYNRHIPKPTRIFESLFEMVTAALGIKKSEQLIGAVVELKRRGKFRKHDKFWKPCFLFSRRQ